MHQKLVRFLHHVGINNSYTFITTAVIYAQHEQGNAFTNYRLPFKCSPLNIRGDFLSF